MHIECGEKYKCMAENKNICSENNKICNGTNIKCLDFLSHYMTEKF